MGSMTTVSLVTAAFPLMHQSHWESVIRPEIPSLMDMDRPAAFRVSQWAPANESAADLLKERLLLEGVVIGAVAYGVHVTFYFICLSLFWSSRKREPRTSWIFIIYITINFILGSIGNATDILENQFDFIDNRDYPGGPVVYASTVTTHPNSVAGFTVFVINAWFQDGLLLYRFSVIFNHNFWAAFIPGIFYVVSIVMSSLMLAEIANPTAGFFSHPSINFALAFWSISIGTTLFLTMLIVLRLMHMKYQICKAFGGKETKSLYLSISATLIESAFLYSIVALIFIITFARKSPIQNLFLPLLGQVQSISPLLILLRVARQRAWTRNTFKSQTASETQLEFATLESTTMQITSDFSIGDRPKSKTF